MNINMKKVLAVMASATVSLIVNANMFDTISLTGTHSGRYSQTLGLNRIY